MKDRDCESCKKFSRGDPHESEGYCEAKRTWVDPQEGEDCKMHEFTLHSANKYKDGTLIYAEPSGLTVGALSDVLVKHTAKQKELSNQLETMENNVCATFKYHADKILEIDRRVNEFSEEYDAVLKTHGDTLEQHTERIEDIYKEYDMIIEKHAERIEDLDDILATHAGKINAHEDTLEEHLDRICDLENLYEKILDDLCAMRDRLCKITDLLVGQNSHAHNFSNFCGNCMHAEMKDGICACELSGEIVDPDSASCSLFDPSYESRKWLENMKKTMTTPSEPTEGCKDCKCAVDGMCVKYNCSLGAICATPECHEPTPF